MRLRRRRVQDITYGISVSPKINGAKCESSFPVFLSVVLIISPTASSSISGTVTLWSPYTHWAGMWITSATNKWEIPSTEKAITRKGPSMTYKMAQAATSEPPWKRPMWKFGLTFQISKRNIQTSHLIRWSRSGKAYIIPIMLGEKMFHM